MTSNPHPADQARSGDYVVRSPRATDALGHALRGVFRDTPMPVEMDYLLRRLDRVTH